MRARQQLLRLSTLIAVCAAAAAACDDDGTGPGPSDTSSDMVLDVPGDTDATEGDGEEDTDATGDATEGDTDATAGDTTDTDAEPDVDETCEPGCGANQRCADPVTDTCECEKGFADCNDDPADGCEAALDQPETCGSCNPGLHCDAFGLEPLCVEALASCDPTRCLPRYMDLDGAAATGCETGLVRLQTSATNLSSAIGAGIDQLVVDQNGTLFALEVGNTVKVHAIAVDEQGVPGVTDSEDTELPPGANGAAGIAAWDGFVAVVRNVDLVIYEYANGDLITVREQTLADAMSVTAIAPQLTGSRAEFVAGAAGGLTWYAVYDKDSEPAELTCFGSEPAASVALCRVSTSATPANARLLAAGALGSGDWVVAVGDSVIEFDADAGPPAVLNGASVSGATLDSGALSIHLLPNNRLAVLDGDALTVLDYTLNAAMRPTDRTESLSHTLGGPATSLAVLDESRIAVGTDSGVELVLINASGPKSGMLSGVTNAVTALAADETHLYIATGSSLAVWQKDLAPVE